MDTIDNSLHAKALFGGAISIMLPTRLADVSDFRPVPDNQEVLADGATDQSIVVEIMVLPVSLYLLSDSFISLACISRVRIQ